MEQQIRVGIVGGNTTHVEQMRQHFQECGLVLVWHIPARTRKPKVPKTEVDVVGSMVVYQSHELSALARAHAKSTGKPLVTLSYGASANAALLEEAGRRHLGYQSPAASADAQQPALAAEEEDTLLSQSACIDLLGMPYLKARVVLSLAPFVKSGKHKLYKKSDVLAAQRRIGSEEGLFEKISARLEAEAQQVRLVPGMAVEVGGDPDPAVPTPAVSTSSVAQATPPPAGASEELWILRENLQSRPDRKYDFLVRVPEDMVRGEESGGYAQLLEIVAADHHISGDAVLLVVRPLYKGVARTRITVEPLVL